MKKVFIKIFTIGALALSTTSCGDKFLETDIYHGVDVDEGLGSPTSVGYALNGVYYRLFQYYFAGNYSTIIGDIASDLCYWNTSTQHFNQINTFTYEDSNSYLYYIWNYGYKVIDNSARIIKACDELLPNATAEEAEDLKIYEAEARCLRAYASMTLANIFCHQVKVNGQDFSSMPGIVVVDQPIVAYEPVERATLGQTYAQVISDLTKATQLFGEAGDQGDLYYFNEAAAYGLLARANMYMENWSAAASAASQAIAISKITELAYTDEEYEELYSSNDSNWESMFALAINSTNNWSANSLGTLFTTYGYSYTPYLKGLYGTDDCRLSIMYFEPNGAEPWSPQSVFSGGKFYFGGGNTAYATCYLVNAPEMFLIEAEAYANLNQPSQAAEALLVVAKRNPAITSTADLPSDKDGILSFLKEERARELFQEGFRLWDLRRWDATANFYAWNGPSVDFRIKNAKASNIVLPIPVDEINAGYGVTQNDNWSSTRPQ